VALATELKLELKLESTLTYRAHCTKESSLMCRVRNLLE